MAENSYIYWDGPEVPDDERRIYIQCRECFDKNGKGTFWDGKLGYSGPVTCPCGKVICERKNVKES